MTEYNTSRYWIYEPDDEDVSEQIVIPNNMTPSKIVKFISKC